MSKINRKYICDCGLIIDRDLNASINLMNYVAKDSKETQNERNSDLVASHVDDVNLPMSITLVV